MAVLPRCLAAAVTLVATVVPAHAQLIRIRSAPIAVFDQFDVFPSANYGMGGASIASRDTLRDPFANPAMGARGTGWFWSSPSLVSHSRNAGGGRSLPLGATLRIGDWFGAVAGAAQQVEPGRAPSPDGPVSLPIDIAPGPVPFFPQGTEERETGNNTYGFLSVGRRFGSFAVGVAASFAELGAVDGVDLLYAQARRIDQHGRASDVRFGLAGELGGGALLQAIVLRHDYRLTHDVSWVDAAWDPATQNFVPAPRDEINVDRTRTWGAQLSYDLPVGAGWRVGATGAVNRMEHPEQPAYGLSAIPRDPGRSAAWNIGVGLSRRTGPVSFALDALLEPISTHTWSSGTDTRFHFRNVHLRMGVGRDFAVGGRGNGGGVQLGLVVRAVDYELTMTRPDARLTEDESWVEWTPTWGLAFRFPELEIRYRGSAANGTGRPVDPFGGPIFVRATSFGPSVLATPGALALQNVSVVTHQFTLAVPLR